MSDIPKGTKLHDSIQEMAKSARIIQWRRQALERAAACVEALDGIENPKQFVTDAFTAAKLRSCPLGDFLTTKELNEGIAAADRILAARDSAAGGTP